jgi:hypothetical protein
VQQGAFSYGLIVQYGEAPLFHIETTEVAHSLSVEVYPPPKDHPAVGEPLGGKRLAQYQLKPAEYVRWHQKLAAGKLYTIVLVADWSGSRNAAYTFGIHVVAAKPTIKTSPKVTPAPTAKQSLQPPPGESTFPPRPTPTYHAITKTQPVASKRSPLLIAALSLMAVVGFLWFSSVRLRARRMLRADRPPTNV